MNFNRLQKIYNQKNYNLIDIKVGQFVELYEKIGEGENQRLWKFKGLIIKLQKPKNPNGTFTIRGQVAGVNVEKVYPLSFPNFEKVLLLDEYKIRKAKLYYIREKIGKAAKFKRSPKAKNLNENILINKI